MQPTTMNLFHSDRYLNWDMKDATSLRGQSTTPRPMKLNKTIVTHTGANAHCVPRVVLDTSLNWLYCSFSAGKEGMAS